MSSVPNDIETRNPYAGHPQLSELEAEVLWEYAKLAKTIKRVDSLAKETAENPNESLLADLRALEKKMGLVLTLFRASVWGLISENQAEQEEREMVMRQQQMQQQGQGHEGDETVRY